MSQTQLDYLDDTYKLTSAAKVVRTGNDERGIYLVLDRTIFHPQGGGQPTDVGSITNDTANFSVTFAGHVDGEVLHYGNPVSGGFAVGDEVKLAVDESRRRLNARIHSAGHLVAFATEMFYPSLTAVKGYHFPEGPYVEFTGEIPESEREEARQKIEGEANEMIKADTPVQTKLVNIEELKKLCKNIPPNLPTDKPTRVMIVGKYTLPCGGTHVKSLSEIGKVVIRKIRVKGGNTRVSYELS